LQIFKKKAIIKEGTGMQIIQRKISELIPADYNPRRMTKMQFEDLKKSFENLGTLEPAVINMYPGRENVIISGHQRLKIAADLQMDEYPCVEVSFDPEKEKEANIRMNKSGGSFDFDLLKNFETADLINWGFQDFELMPKEKKGKDVSFKTKPKIVKCPKCDHEFDSKEHKIKNDPD